VILGEDDDDEMEDQIHDLASDQLPVLRLRCSDPEDVATAVSILVRHSVTWGGTKKALTRALFLQRWTVCDVTGARSVA
jgi:hypothetical protein